VELRLCRWEGGGWSGPGRAASGAIGEVAVDADHAPFHAPGGADQSAVLDDGIADRPPAPVRGLGAAAAEAAGHGAGRPRPERHLPNAVEGHDLQAGVPELALLEGKTALDGGERGRLVAGWNDPVEARAGEVDVLFEPGGGERGGTRHQQRCDQRGGDDGGPGPAGPLFSPAAAGALTRGAAVSAAHGVGSIGTHPALPPLRIERGAYHAVRGFERRPAG